MWKKSLILLICVAAAASAPAAARADVDPDGYALEHQPQIGSCGNVWAKATIIRRYSSVKTEPDQDKWLIKYGGRFTTRTGPSPAACSPTTQFKGISIEGRLHGRLSWWFSFRVNHPGGPTFNPLGVCELPCTPDQFVAGFYPPGTTWRVAAPRGLISFDLLPLSPPQGCAAAVGMALDWPGFTPATGQMNGDIATTC